MKIAYEIQIVKMSFCDMIRVSGNFELNVLCYNMTVWSESPRVECAFCPYMAGIVFEGILWYENQEESHAALRKRILGMLHTK